MRRTRPGFLVALHGGGCARSNVCSAPQTAFLRRLCLSLPPPNPKYSGRGGRVACRSQMRGPERPWPEPELRAAGMRP